MTETPQQDRIDREHLRDYSQLRRSVTDRKVAGVAGGLGRHLNIDPTILRVAFVVLAFFGGAGFLLYGVLWLFVPEEGRDEAVISTSAGSRNAVIVVTGVLAALLLIGDSWGGLGFPWPLAVVALVLVLFLTNRDKPVSATYNPPPSQESGDQPGPQAPPPTGRDPLAPPAAETGPYTSPYSGSVPPTAAPYPVQQPPAPRPDRAPRLFWFTVALLAVVLGALGMYDALGGGVVDSAYPALALAVIGTMLVVGAWFGRPGGLIALGVVAAIALLATSATQPRWAGQRWVEETPTLATQVESRYYVPAGSLHVDMSNIRDVARLDGKTVQVEANAGDIVVTLPEGVDVDVDTNIAGAGEISVLDETTGGVGRISLDRSVDGGPDAPQMNLDVDLSVGNIEVRQ